MGELLGVMFFDLDNEIKSFFEISIERLQDSFLTIHSFLNEAAKALVHLLNRPQSEDQILRDRLSPDQEDSDFQGEEVVSERD